MSAIATGARLDDAKTYGMTGPPDWLDGELVPLTQAAAAAQNLALVARVGNDPSAFEHALHGAIRGVCATCAVSNIASMKTVVSNVPPSLAWLAGGLALLAVMLATSGSTAL